MIGPDGTVEKDTSDREPKACMNGLIDFQKKFRLKIPGKKFLTFVAAIADGDKAAEAGKWKDALAAYAKVDAEGKKLSSLQPEVKAKVDALNAKVADAFAKARDGDGDLAAKGKAVKALRAEVSARL